MRETVRNDFFLRIMTWQQKGIEEAVQYVVPVFPARRRRLPHRRKDRMLSFEMKRPLAAEPGNSYFPHTQQRACARRLSRRRQEHRSQFRGHMGKWRRSVS